VLTVGSNNKVVVIVYCLLAIHKRRCDAAHNLLTSLMVDHVSEVNIYCSPAFVLTVARILCENLNFKLF